MGSNFKGKSLKKQSAEKKNFLVYILMFLILASFVISIYNAVDMDSAIEAYNLEHKVLKNPKIDENNSKSETKVSWAINMENTVDNMKSEQKRMVIKLSEELKDEIIASNAIVLNEIGLSSRLLKGKFKELRDKNMILQKQMAELRLKTDSNLKMVDIRLKKQKKDMSNYIEDNVLLPPPAIESVSNTESRFVDSDSPSSDMFDKLKIVKKTAKIKKPKKNKEFKIVSFNNSFTDGNQSTGDDELTPEEIEAMNTFEIVTGFTDGYLITGAYAPLFADGGTGSSKSVPVLIETNGDLLMPNHTIGSIDKCFVLGVTTGNAGARSVEIRLDKMTCLVADSKKILQGKIDGYVVSETGSPGLPATMIYKAGDFIARMIGAGILEGLSTAIVNSASGYNNAAQGGGQFYGNTLTGAGNGMSNAFTKLSDFYLQLAEATLPILEVKPGRFVSLVLVGGNTFQLKDINLLDTRDVDNYVDEFVGE